LNILTKKQKDRDKLSFIKIVIFISLQQKQQKSIILDISQKKQQQHHQQQQLL
jgi:hypothetical protein